MDSSSDIDELPYVVWYQCRMCTHVLVDDVEKMLSHFEKKHGAMIDVEELRSTVYKNGLCMGGLPRSPKSGARSEGGSDETEFVSSYLQEDKDAYEDLKPRVPKVEIGSDDVVLEPDEKEEGYSYDDDYYNVQEQETGDEEYEEEAYQSTNGKYSQSVHDDEEQLEEGEFEVYSNGGNGMDQDEQDESEELNVNDSHVEDNMSQLQHDDYDDYEYQNDQEEREYNEGDEDDDETAENSNHDDGMYGEADYDDTGDYDDGMVENEEICADNGNQGGAILNYGFSCKFCGKFFTTRRGVESHEQHHKTQASPVVRRANEHRLFPCKICKDKSFPSFKDLKLHVKTHTPERIHICKFCFSTFNNTASLTKHLAIHENQNPHKCHCGKSFVSANTLKIHKKIHTGIKPFVCNFYQCGRAFVTKSTLESHLRTHTGEKPYVCSFCPSSFTTSSAKYRHERHVHKVPEPSIM